MKKIIILVSPEGETTVEAEGFTGSSCTDATKAIEKALGVALERVKKPEFHQQERNEQRLQE